MEMNEKNWTEINTEECENASFNDMCSWGEAN